MKEILGNLIDPPEAPRLTMTINPEAVCYEVALPGVRWLVRDGVRVLQYPVSVVRAGIGGGIEWRDVPEVVE